MNVAGRPVEPAVHHVLPQPHLDARHVLQPDDAPSALVGQEDMFS